MSFNSLPDELIAQVASHVTDYEDTVSLLQTQTRIQSILKTFRMNRPEVDALNIYLGSGELKFASKLNGRRIFNAMKLAPEKENSLGVPFSKFRSIDILALFGDDGKFVMTDDVAEQILKTNVKISRCSINKIKIDVSSKMFLLLFNTFSRIHFNDCEDSDKYLNDDSCLNRGHSFTLTAGILNPDQQTHARTWLEYVKQHPELNYTIDSYGSYRQDTFYVKHESTYLSCDVTFKIVNNNY